MNQDEKDALYRVEGRGNTSYMSATFSKEAINQRRNWIRHKLRGTTFENLSNDQIDGSRLWLGPETDGCFFENENGYEFFVASPKISKGESDFRKAQSMIPFEYMGLKPSDFDWSIYGTSVDCAKSVMNKYILRFPEFKNKGMGLYIYSKTKGSGKTMLSCCLLNELSDRYAGSVKFINMLDFLEMSKQRQDQEIESLYICSVLVVDDLGVQLAKEWVDSVFYRLVNHRYNNRKITIYTSNVEINELKMDDRILDRIESRSFEIHIPEVSIRSMKRKEEKDLLLNEKTL